MHKISPSVDISRPVLCCPHFLTPALCRRIFLPEFYVAPTSYPTLCCPNFLPDSVLPQLPTRLYVAPVCLPLFCVAPTSYPALCCPNFLPGSMLPQSAYPYSVLLQLSYTDSMLPQIFLVRVLSTSFACVLFGNYE